MTRVVALEGKRNYRTKTCMLATTAGYEPLEETVGRWMIRPKKIDQKSHKGTKLYQWKLV